MSPSIEGMEPRPFYSGELNTQTYDLGVGRTGLDDDLKFYVALSAATGPRVLELGCGTGRVTIELAKAGLQATGLDSSAGMLREAFAKMSSLDQETADRLEFVEGEMSTLSLGTQFDTVLIPARAFAFLLTPEGQLECLRRVFEHLRPGGMLSLDLFDPRLDLCQPDVTGGRSDERRDPATGRVHRVDVLSRKNDVIAQVMRETWRFTEMQADGSVLRVAEEELSLRWTYRYEMRHLLALAGFAQVVEYSDFEGSPPAYGQEQIWVCRRPEAGGAQTRTKESAG